MLLWWQSDLYDGTFHREDSYKVTFSLSRTFLDDLLNVRFIANNIFHGNRGDGDYRMAETNITFNNKWNSNYFRLVVGCNLGKLENKKFEHRNTGASEAARK
ncbi:MAG: outer membrane beta-barrel protein [Bacteroidota bacterium]